MALTKTVTKLWPTYTNGAYQVGINLVLKDNDVDVTVTNVKQYFLGR
jgi:hypothetical protein